MPRSLLAVLISILIAPAVTAATISGTITASQSGQPLTGIIAAAYTPAGELVTTASSDFLGRYALTVPAGEVRILAYDLAGIYATSYYSNAESFELSNTFNLTASQTVKGIDFSLLRGGRISGSVADDMTGALLSGMTVAAYTMNGIVRERVMTEAGGTFSILLPPGDYLVAAWDEQFRYVPEFYENADRASLAKTIRVTAGTTTPGVGFSLTLGATVTGSVRDRHTFEGLTGIVISAYGASGEIRQQRKSEAGQFIMAVPPGATRFVAHDDTGMYAGSFFDDAESFSLAATLQLSRGQSVSGIDFPLARAGRVAGRVTDAATGSVLGSMAVAVYNLSGTLRQLWYADAAGNYSIVLPPGEYRLAGWDDHLVYAAQFWNSKTTFAQSDAVFVAAQQTSTADFTLYKLARISGSTINQQTRDPLPSIRAAALDPSGATVASILTDASGGFTLSVPPGTYKLEATDPAGAYHPAYESNASSLDSAPARTLASGQVVSGVTLELRAATTSGNGSIGGTVTAAENGKVLSGIAVAAYTPEGNLLAAAMTDSFGRYTLNLPASQVRLLAYDLAAVFAKSYYSNAASFETSHTFTLAASQSVTGINFSLVKGGRISGSVVSEDTAAALSGFTVAAYTTSGLLREQVMTDGAGNFSLLLPPGDFLIACWDEQFRYVSEFYDNVVEASLATPVKVTSNGSVSGIQFAMSLGATVAGTVSDQQTGASLHGMTVSAWSPSGVLLARTASSGAGEFMIAVPAGTVRFTAHDDKAVYASTFYDHAESFSLATDVLVTRSQFLGGIHLPMTRGGRIEGRVATSSDAALARIVVGAFNPSGSTRLTTYSDEEGHYFLLLPPGPYKIAAWDDLGSWAHQFWQSKVTFTEAHPITVASEQMSTANFSLSLAARVSGSTADSATRAPLAAIRIVALDLAGTVVASTSSNAQGTYTLALPAGSYKLKAVDPAARYLPAWEGTGSSFETAPSRTVSTGQVLNGANFELHMAPIKYRAVRTGG